MKIVLILPPAGIYRFGTGAFSKFIRYSPMTLAALAPPDLHAEIEMYDEGPFVDTYPMAILKNDKPVRCCEMYHTDE